MWEILNDTEKPIKKAGCQTIFLCLHLSNIKYVYYRTPRYNWNTALKLALIFNQSINISRNTGFKPLSTTQPLDKIRYRILYLIYIYIDIYKMYFCWVYFHDVINLKMQGNLNNVFINKYKISLLNSLK